MATSRRSEEELKAMMPHKTIPKVRSDTTRPTWQSIKICHALLAENAASIPSCLGDAQLGHAAIVVGATRYTDLSTTDEVYIIPQEAVPPIYAVGMSYHQREELKREYEYRVIDHYTHKSVETILTKMYLDSIHEDYKTAFYTEELGYRCSFAELDAYMEDNFNKKTSKELADNEKDMKMPWIADKPIESLFRHIDAGRRFDPSIPEETIVRNTVDIICINDGFDDAFTTWNARCPVDQTWSDLKEHFGAVDKARASIMALKKISKPATYPGSANSITSTTPQGTLSTNDRLGSTIEKLLIALSNSDSSTVLAAASATARPGRQGTTTSDRAPRTSNLAGGRIPMAEEAATMSYCWSHGFCKKQDGKPEHTGASCGRHRVGHQATATPTRWEARLAFATVGASSSKNRIEGWPHYKKKRSIISMTTQSCIIRSHTSTVANVYRTESAFPLSTHRLISSRKISQISQY
jgi:hypothetical protein